MQITAELDWDNAEDIYLWMILSTQSAPGRSINPYTAPKKGVIFPLTVSEYRTGVPVSRTGEGATIITTDTVVHATGSMVPIGSLDTSGSNNKTVDITLNGDTIGTLHYVLDLTKQNYSSGSPEALYGGAYPDKSLRRIEVNAGDILSVASSSSYPTMQGSPQFVGRCWTFVPYKE